MEKFATSNIRNVCLIGHSAAGKTSLAEAMLYITKGSQRLGKIVDGNTVCDYDPEEVKRQISISASVAPVVKDNVKINVIDTPGYLDFIAEVIQGLKVAGSGIIVVDGKSGVEIGTEIAWEKVTEAGIPKAVVVNKIDDPETKFDKVFEELKEKFGSSICPFFVPANGGKAVVDLVEKVMYTYDGGKSTKGEIPSDILDGANTYIESLMDEVASTSDELMEKYFGGEDISRQEILDAVKDGFLNNQITPVFVTSATNLVGVDALSDTIKDMFPNPLQVAHEVVVNGEEEKPLAVEENGPATIFVFKTVADAFVGKMSFIKVVSGKLNASDELKNLETGASEKLSHIYTICGKTQSEVDTLAMGDIGMTAKLSNTNTNDTLSANPGALPIKKIVYPESFYSMAVAAKAKGEEDKISQGIIRLLEEDLSYGFENNAVTKQLIVYGQGDTHLSVLVSKLKSRFGTTVDLVPPKVAYKETIKGNSDVQGKYKKQSGGHGQYGDVHIRFSHSEQEGLEFVQSVVGGSVPKNFYPAVEKGLLEAMNKGVLAGYPVVNLKADLYDGSYHPVDSSEMAFKVAASLAYKEGLPQAKPIILEPIGKVNVFVPGDLLGDVMGELTKRRGRVLGMTPTKKKGEQLLEAEAPMSEMFDFAIQLRAMTRGAASYTIRYERYEEVPAEAAQKIIEEAKKNAEEEE